MTPHYSFHRATILVVFPDGDDRKLLERILGNSEWSFRFAGTFEEASDAMRASLFEAILTESRLSEEYGWRDILREAHAIQPPPQLIVADRLADEALWAEVLNLGGYDLLLKPFDPTEVVRVVAMACRFGRRATQAAPRRKAPASARSGGQAQTQARAASRR